jgi:hypothetical protein
MSSHSPAAPAGLLPRTMARMSPSIESVAKSEIDNFASAAFIVFSRRA